jgi:hypothetical protein
MSLRADVIVLGTGMVRVSVAAIPERVEQSMQALAPLMVQCVKEHDALIAEVGSTVESLVAHRGWLHEFDSV